MVEELLRHVGKFVTRREHGEVIFRPALSKETETCSFPGLTGRDAQ